ncbi:MAG: hypothetical protein WDZ52_15085 [Pseudohongiellaceae bacterium]
MCLAFINMSIFKHLHGLGLPYDGVCLERDSRWTENLAVGSKTFVEGYQSRMGVKVEARNVGQNQGDWFLREPAATYSMFSSGKIQL